MQPIKAQFIDELVDTKVAIGRMMPIYWKDEQKNHGKLNFPKKWAHMEVTKGVFKYSNQLQNKNHSVSVFRNLEFKVDKNQKVGIVGKSGSGKSTLVKILIGLSKFNAGEYKISDTNFYDIKSDDITQHIALVLQDSEMFNLSLKENITLLRDVDYYTLKNAIKVAQLEELIEKLPEGLGTLIGEKGYRLSGGERQRVRLARAICKNPEILILDEATSSLDSKTEDLIQKGLEQYLKDKTVIMIAHRISTLKNVDKICVIENGEIIEEGTFNELANDPNSKFSDIYKNQNK